MNEIPLTQNKSALVDDDDYEYLSMFKWHAYRSGSTFYASRKLKSVGKYQVRQDMHRAILGKIQSGYETDHINGNGLDNRKCNLRIVTTRQNQQNQHAIKSSKYCGVTKKGNGWQSQIDYNGRRRYLGLFKTEADANAAYLIAEKVLIERGAP